MKIIFVIIFYYLCNISDSIAQSTDQYGLFEICKIWGYVKYESNSDKNIDYQLFDVLNNKMTLDQFINLHEPPDQKRKHNEDSLEIDCTDDSWINNMQQITDEDKSMLRSMKYSPHKNVYFKNLYPPLLHQGKYYNENDFKEDTVSKEKVVLGVSRLWNFLNFYYPYRCDLLNWDEVLKESLKIASVDFSKKAYEAALMNIVYNLKDAHTAIYYTFPKLSGLMYKGFAKIMPMDMTMNGNNCIITRSFDTILHPGDTITTINGVSPLMFLKEINPLDTFHKTNKVLSINTDSARIDVQRMGSHISFNINKQLISLEKWFDNNFDNNYVLYLPPVKDNAGVINVNSIRSKSDYENAKETFYKYDTILLNLEGYPKSHYANDVVQLFYPVNSTLTHYLVYPDYDNPGHFKLSPVYEKGYYKGGKKIYVRINNFTQSWSETLTLSLMCNKDVSYIGENTANGIGEVDYVLALPCGLNFVTSDLGVFNLYKKSNYPTGIAPTDESFQ